MPTAAPTLVMLDPNTLTVHPNNARRDLGDLRDLTRSVKAVGVQVALTVVPTEDGGHLIVDGHRRHAAAIAAGCRAVPCVVRDDLDAQADQIAGMLVVNGDREDLTGGEQAAAIQQLALLGLSDAVIAKKTGRTKKLVETARKVAASDVATEVADRHGLTLDQAAVLAEFEDDSQAVKRLAVAAVQNPASFLHIASQLRQDREAEAEHAAVVEALTAAGVTVIEGTADRGKATRLSDLTDQDDGTPLTPETHAECPGRAATFGWDPTTPIHFCLDPDAYGHRERHPRLGRAAAPSGEEASAERRKVIANNKAWRAAEPVRRQYVRELLARRTVPKGALRFVTAEILAVPERVGDGKDDLLADLLGVECPKAWGRSVGEAHVAALAEARLPLALLAQVAADREQTMDVHTWRNSHPAAAARWLSFLASTGYGLAEIEQYVIDVAAERTADHDAGEAPDADVTDPDNDAFEDEHVQDEDENIENDAA